MMTNEYENKIFLGDSLEILRRLPDESVDAVITDPPYSSGGRTIYEKSKSTTIKYKQSDCKRIDVDFSGDSKDSRSWLHWCNLWMRECNRILKDGGYFLMFTDWRQLPTTTDALQIGEFIWRGIAVWDKTLAARAPHKGYFRHQCEFIVWGTKGQCRIATHAGPYPGCFTFPVKQSDKFHLTGKPTLLMEELVKIVPEDGIILDPFAGSGTTAVACKRQNRKFIGIEKNKEYYQICLDRLAGLL